MTRQNTTVQQTPLLRNSTNYQAFVQALNAQLQQKPGVPLTIYDISGLVKFAHEKAMTPTNIIAGFKKLAYSP